MAENAVEYGPRAFPVIQLLRDDLIAGKDLYFVERDSTAINKLKESLLENKIDTNKIIVGDAENLPIHHVDTIFAKDLFGQHGHAEIIGQGKTTGRTAKVGDFDKIARIWHKNSNSKGKVVILEVGTPPDKQEIIKTFENNGFKLTEQHNKGSIKQIFKQFGTETLEEGQKSITVDSIVETATEDSYALIFERK